MHLPESIGYITRKLERALKQDARLIYEETPVCYITRKLERALKQLKILQHLENYRMLYNP